MDYQRFDALTRMIASRQTRRRVFGTLATLGAALTRKIPASAQCSDPETCTDSSECCNSACVDGVCGCLETGSDCSIDAQCCGNRCIDGTCVSCLPDGSASDDWRKCCSETVYDGVCVSCVAGGGDECEVGDCCSGMCVESEVGGSCADCRAPGLACASGEQCCSGECVQGVCTIYACGQGIWQECDLTRTCVNGFCYPPDQVCIQDRDCGSGSVCCGSLCVPGECCDGSSRRCADGQTCQGGVCAEVACAGEGDMCSVNDDCCNQLVCQSGTCIEAADDLTPTSESTQETTPEMIDPVATTAATDSPGGIAELPDTGYPNGGDGRHIGSGIVIGASGLSAVAFLNRFRKSEPSPLSDE